MRREVYSSVEWNRIECRPEKYREHGSTAPRTGPSSQEGRTHRELKYLLAFVKSIYFMVWIEIWHEADHIHRAAPRKRNFISVPDVEDKLYNLLVIF